MTFNPLEPTLLSSLAVLDGTIECNDPRHVEIAWRYVQWARSIWTAPIYVSKQRAVLALREAA